MQRHLQKALRTTLTLLLLSSPFSAQAVLLYGVQFGNPNLVTVDTLTGSINNVGLLPAGSDPINSNIQGLTGTASGNLLYTDGNLLGGVQELNPLTAALITTHALPGVFNRGGLSFDTPSNTLYTVNSGAPVASQAGLGGAVDVNFIPTFSSIAPGAIGGDDNGRHFAQGNVGAAAPVPGIHEFDSITGAILNSLPFPNGINVSGLAFDGLFLYVSEVGSQQLYTLNPDTGVILNQVGYSGGSLSALAALPSQISEPTTLALIVLGLLGLVASRKRFGQR